MAQLNPDGLWVELPSNVRIMTPGLRGEVVVHATGSDGMRGAEETRTEFLAALEHNDMTEDVTLEIKEPDELSRAEGSRGAGGDDDMTVEVPDPGEGFAQVVLYESEDGVISWHLPQERNTGVTTRGGGTLSYRIPRTVAVPDPDDAGAQRGILGAVGSKIIKVLTFRLLNAGAKWVGEEYGRAIEARYKLHQLVRYAPDCYTLETPQPLTPAEIGALDQGRALLVVHGTFSSAYGAFHLLPPDVFSALYQRYGGRVFALNHPTVAFSPVENVAGLANQLNGLGLPPLEVDVLAHSRGGLVCRVLTEQAGLGQIAGRLAVRNLVMVAAPNAGTALADVKHLGQLLDRVSTLLQLVPDNGITDALDVILSVVKQLATGFVSGLDGLMSMNPSGQFLTRILNVPGGTDATYFAAASNFEPPTGSKLLRIARDAGTDLVFGQSHNDLVVPTEGVFTVPGANEFPIAEPLVFDAADGVDHSGYWTQPKLAEKLATWLPG
jgi:hypothetical protein